MNNEDIKNALMEILGEGNIRGRRWFFPKNVNNQYKIIANMTLKEIILFMVPALVVSILITVLPPFSSIAFWIIKAIFIIIIIVIPVFYVNYRPVKHRENIRTRDFIKEYVEYKQKQKIYFIKPKNKYWE